jgi:transcription-repair coupling factor (superfamily II helicase)
VDRLKSWQGERVLFVAPTQGDATRLRELLAGYDFQLPISGQPQPQLIADGQITRAIVRGHLNQGFRLPQAHLVFLTFDELFGTRKRQVTSAAKTHPSHFLTSLSELKQDDYVVHLDHGIGIYRGLKFLTVAGIAGEFLHLEYEGGDRLYLPVDRINMVQKYIGGDGAQPALDKLGGTAWEKVKAKARKQIFAMAGSWFSFTRCAKRARAMLLLPRTTCTRNSKRRSNSKRRPISSAPSTKRSPTCSGASRWTA